MRLTWMLSLLFLTACPGDDASPVDETTTTSSSSTATSMTSTPSTGVVDGSGSDDGLLCPGFEDEVAPSPISIEITNDRADPVWIPLFANCNGSVPHAIVGPGGEALPPLSLYSTCEGAAQGQCPTPPPFCDELTGLYIEPGAAVQYAWSGLDYVDETIPEACPGIAECGPTCQRAVLPDEGTYTFTIEVGRPMGCATEPCECIPTDGSCTLNDPTMSFGMLMDVSGTLDLPGESTVQIVIE